MKFARSSKLLASLLLVALLLTSVGVLFGYAWCVGIDGHVDASYATASRCCADDAVLGVAHRYTAPSISRSSSNPCGVCLDFTVQQCEAVFSKRAKRLSTASFAPSSTNDSNSSAMLSLRLRAGKVLPQLPLRIAQTLLALRTVVLLD